LEASDEVEKYRWIEFIKTHLPEQFLGSQSTTQPKSIFDSLKKHQHLLLPKISKQGYLNKKGEKNRSYKKRWFVLVEGFLYYYDSPKSSLL